MLQEFVKKLEDLNTTLLIITIQNTCKSMQWYL